jgi:hypothetical protein
VGGTSRYAHEARGLYAELVYGAAFEWVPDTDPTNGSAAATTPLHGWAGAGGATLDPNASQIPGGTSLRLVGPATATNRGFGNEVSVSQCPPSITVSLSTSLLGALWMRMIA